MNILHAIILGLVQGIAEFLPISSSGHLVILQEILVDEPSLTFDIVVHLGTLVAIVIMFWQDIWSIIKKPWQKLTGLLVVGTLPVVIAGFLLRDIIESHFRNSLWLAAAFLITGILLVIADRFKESAKSEITYVDALFVGICQALDLPPGISRSGTTITGALYRGIDRITAAKFSFLLAMIAIAGAGVLEAWTLARGDAAVQIEAIPLFVGFAVSAVVGCFAIKLLLKLLKTAKLRYFSYYVWILAALLLLDFFTFGLV